MIILRAPGTAAGGTGFYGRLSIATFLHRHSQSGSVPSILLPGGKASDLSAGVYTRIEDKPLLRNSPEALAAVWGVCVQVAEELALSRFPEHIDSERDHALWP